MEHYKSIFISDLHLGTRGCQADALCDFLKNNTCDNLFLVGDILDGWRLKKRWYFPQSHTNVIRRILTSAKRNTKVYYILGNHDEMCLNFLAQFQHRHRMFQLPFLLGWFRENRFGHGFKSKMEQMVKVWQAGFPAETRMRLPFKNPIPLLCGNHTELKKCL